MNFSFNELGIVFKFDMIATLMIGLVSLYLGQKIKENVKALHRFGIPSAVMGGIIFSLVHLLIRETAVGSFSFDTTLQSPFMLVFFTTIGLASSIEGLKKGGKLLIIFWLLSGFMTVMQAVIGVGISKVNGINPLFGVLCGPVSMSGGHGSAAAFGASVESMGLTGAATVALSAATFGIISGGLLGAPLAISLIKKYNLKPINPVNKDEVGESTNEVERKINVKSMMSHIFMLSVLMTIGITLSSFLKSSFNLAIPSYVGAMLCAIIFNNLNNKFNFIDIDRHLVNILGETSLNIFLSMALISLKLWELKGLAIPILAILVCQVFFMWFYTKFIVFPLIGKDYDAAVMISGMCGSGLGATPNAMINMGEVSGRYGYTVNPYIVVPLTGAFLIDIFQMPVIIGAINIFKSSLS